MDKDSARTRETPVVFRHVAVAARSERLVRMRVHADRRELAVGHAGAAVVGLRCLRVVLE